MEDVLARHNLFKNHDDMSLYDGHVRPDLYSLYPVFDENFKRRNITNELNGAYHVNVPSLTAFRCHFSDQLSS